MIREELEKAVLKRVEEGAAPKWVKDVVANLAMKLEETRKNLREARDCPGSSGVVTANPYGDVPIRLEDNETVRFQLGPHHEDVIDVRLDDYVGFSGKHQKMLRVGMHGQLRIYPNSSNVAYVGVNER